MFKTPNAKTRFWISALWFFPLIWYSLQAYFFTHAGHAVYFYNDVSNVYQSAGQHWFQGLPLYNGSGFGFVYFPTSAAIMAAFSWLPVPVFAFAFRIISILSMLFGLQRFSLMFKPEFSSKVYFFTSLVAVILCQACMREGQMHMLITGLVLLGLAALAEEQWYCAAFYLALAVALKPTAIVFALLAFALFPRLSWRLILVAALMFGATFLLQHPSYVWQQYVACVHSYQSTFKYDGTNPGHWATLFGALAFYFDYSMSGAWVFSLRLLFALLTLGICYRIGKRFGSQQLVCAIFILGMAYLMLFNSRTENNDYVMMAPALGLTLAYAVMAKQRAQLVFHVVLLGLLVMNWNLCRLLMVQNNIWLSPSLICLYAIYATVLLAQVRLDA